MVKMPPPLLEIGKQYQEDVQAIVRKPELVAKLKRESDAEQHAQTMMVRNLAINNVMLLCVKPNGDIILNKYKRSGVVLQQWNFGQP